MKRLAFSFVAIMFAAAVADTALAQPPEGRRGEARGQRFGGQGQGQGRRGEAGPRRGPGGPGGPGGPRGEFGPPPHPIIQALDTNGDFEISAEEIKNAAAALKKLDKNNDGKLSREELRPQFARGRGRGPGAGGPGFGPPAERREGEGGGRGRPLGRGDGTRPGPQQFIARIMEFDKNKDGKLSKEELPERMQRIIDRADANNDGAVDKEELIEMHKRFTQGGQRGREPREGGRPPRPQRSNEE